jgi:dTDP-4-amino-4,6-dideoxygalactose transaminase
MVVSSDASLAGRIEKLRVHGSTKQYIHDEIGYNSRLDSLQAAVLRIKLKKLDSWLEGRRSVAARYNEAFSSLDVITPKVAAGNNHTYHQYTIAFEDRDGLLKHLNDKGIAARIYYPVPMHLQPCYKDLGYSKGSFPVSEKAAESVLSLPVYPELSREQIEYVINAVKEFVK